MLLNGRPFHWLGTDVLSTVKNACLSSSAINSFPNPRRPPPPAMTLTAIAAATGRLCRFLPHLFTSISSLSSFSDFERDDSFTPDPSPNSSSLHDFLQLLSHAKSLSSSRKQAMSFLHTTSSIEPTRFSFGCTLGAEAGPRGGAACVAVVEELGSEVREAAPDVGGDGGVEKRSVCFSIEEVAMEEASAVVRDEGEEEGAEVREAFGAEEEGEEREERWEGGRAMGDVSWA